jgi:hypothetical protein
MNVILRGGQAIGVIGLVLMAVAVLGRAAGRYVVGGFEAATWLQAGIGATAAGCFALLWVIAARARA